MESNRLALIRDNLSETGFDSGIYQPPLAFVSSPRFAIFCAAFQPLWLAVCIVCVPRLQHTRLFRDRETKLKVNGGRGGQSR